MQSVLDRDTGNSNTHKCFQLLPLVSSAEGYRGAAACTSWSLGVSVTDKAFRGVLFSLRDLSPQIGDCGARFAAWMDRVPPPLFTQTSQVEDSMPESSQDAQWAAFLALAKTKGLARASALLSASEPMDSGIVADVTCTEQDLSPETSSGRPKRLRKLTNKDFPPDPPPCKTRTQPPHRDAVLQQNLATSVGPATPQDSSATAGSFATREDLGKMMDTLRDFMAEVRAGHQGPSAPRLVEKAASLGKGANEAVAAWGNNASTLHVTPVGAAIASSTSPGAANVVHSLAALAAGGELSKGTITPPSTATVGTVADKGVPFVAGAGPQPSTSSSGLIASSVAGVHTTGTTAIPAPAISSPIVPSQLRAPPATTPQVSAAPLLSGRCSLSWQVPQACKEAIWRHEVIDIFSLLMLGQDGLDARKAGLKEDDKKVKFQAWPEKNIENWLEAFSILSSVIIEKQPEAGQGLLQNGRLIHTEALKWGGNGWLNYDREFRKKMSLCPEMSWDQKEVQLWLDHMGSRAQQGTESTFKAQAGRGTGKGSFVWEAHGFKQTFRGGVKRGGQRGVFCRPSAGTCRLFNKGSCSWGKTCRFQHACSRCGGPHPAVSCHSQQERTTAGRGRQDS